MPEFGNRLEVICLESEAFYALVEEVVNRLKEKNGIEQEKWINDEEAMKLLHISSKTPRTSASRQQINYMLPALCVGITSYPASTFRIWMYSSTLMPLMPTLMSCRR